MLTSLSTSWKQALDEGRTCEGELADFVQVAFCHLFLFVEVLPEDLQPSAGCALARLFPSPRAAGFVPGSLASLSRSGRTQLETLWPKWILRQGLGHNGLLNFPSLFGRSPSSGRLGGARLVFYEIREPVPTDLCRHI